MTSTPSGQSKAADENTDAIENAKATSTKKPKAAPASSAEEAPLPTPASPIEPLEEGKVQVTTNAKEGQNADPAGKVSEVKKATVKRVSKKDPLKSIDDLTKLPVAVTVGQVNVTIEEHAGSPVASLSLVGWVGDAPVKILAADLDEVERAIGEIRKQLS